MKPARDKQRTVPAFSHLLLAATAALAVTALAPATAGAQSQPPATQNPPPATPATPEPEKPGAKPSGAGDGQDQPPQATEANAPPAVPQQDDEAVFDPSEPDFTVINIPTTARLPKFKSAFRLTHRFARPLGEGDFSDLLSDFFGLDAGAQIGLEFRISLLRKSQVGIYRTSDKTIQFFGQYSILREGQHGPLSVDALASIEGTNNFQDSYSPALGAVVSRKLKTRGAVYIMPQWINNSNPEPKEVVDDNDTFVLGLGARIRVTASTYLVGEFTPRLTGYAPGVHYGSFGIEKRYGGHVFQLNFSNSIGTTPAQVARGGYQAEDWYIGFNLSRKFF